MAEYTRMSREDRRAIDNWLAEENLAEYGITYLRVGEGYVEADCLVGIVAGVAVTERRRFVVQSLPPLGPFSYTEA